MKIAVMVIAIVLSACATPEMQRQNAMRLVATYGPRCEAAGFARGSQDYQDCIIGFVRQAQMQAVANSLTAVGNAYTPPRAVNCTSYNMGGIVQTRCQ